MANTFQTHFKYCKANAITIARALRNTWQTQKHSPISEAGQLIDLLKLALIDGS
jgi:hypothetical protein